MSFDYRLYENGDELEILRLFSLSFGKEMDPLYWKWRYVDNVVKNNFINLVMDDKTIAAHYALSPSRLYVDQELVNAGLSMTTMTHPDYRGKRLFTQSAEDLYEKCKADLDVVYGVPNGNSIKGFTKYLDFKVISEIYGYELDTTHNNSFEENKKCKSLEEFDYRFDDLMNNIISKYRVILSRDSQYLNWRFIENPENDYKVVYYEDDGSIKGYAVTKLFNGEDGVCGDIVDIIALNQDAFSALIETATTSLIAQNVTKIKIWVTDELYKKKIVEMGYFVGKEQYNFIVKNNNNLDDELIMNFDNWYLTMSDIDIF